MSRIFAESELAALRRQFFSEALGQELTQETADALINAATALSEAQQANAAAVQALEEATSALEAAQSAATPADVIAALSGYATEGFVTGAVASAFDGGVAAEIEVGGKTLVFDNRGILVEVNEEEEEE